MEDAFEVFARNLGTLTADDSVINTVVPMDVQYLWSDKYRPRKPRVFNKVHTVRSLPPLLSSLTPSHLISSLSLSKGYDWNQYNKKHYDTDNPPPKTVQGYKFNVRSPSLVDP